MSIANIANEDTWMLLHCLWHVQIFTRLYAHMLVCSYTCIYTCSYVNVLISTVLIC